MEMQVNAECDHKLILVGGSQRSGTTLVQTLLCNLTESLPVWPEAHHVNDQISSYRDADKLWNKSKFYFGTRVEMQEFYREVARSIVNRGQDHAAMHGTVILKDPRFSGMPDAVFALFPDAYLVSCVRDPRDVVSSYLQIRERERGRRLNATERSKEIIKAAERYRRAYPEYENHADAVVPVYYEQVVAHPATVVVEVARKCGLSVRQEDMEVLEWAPEGERHQPAWVTELEGRPPSSREVGKFRRVLSTREIARVEWICGSELIRYGYVPYAPAAKWNRLRRLKHRLVSRGRTA